MLLRERRIQDKRRYATRVETESISSARAELVSGSREDLMTVGRGGRSEKGRSDVEFMPNKSTSPAIEDEEETFWDAVEEQDNLS